MPSREDEWRQILSGRHPPYCTCTECVSGRPKRRASGLAGWLKGRIPVRERTKAHPANCACATCALLRSVGSLGEAPPTKGNFIRRLFGKT
jgi:hypothetical protein